MLLEVQLKCSSVKRLDLWIPRGPFQLLQFCDCENGWDFINIQHMFITIANNKTSLDVKLKAPLHLYNEADCSCCGPWYAIVFSFVLKEFPSRTTCSLLLGVELQHKLSKQSGNINTFFPPYQIYFKNRRSVERLETYWDFFRQTSGKGQLVS